MAELIGFFEESLAAEAALASFIPVMLGTGGNVGTQAATIAVRNLATGQIAGWTSFEMLSREIKVGSLLGFAFALILGGYAFLRYGTKLGVAISISTTSTVICAAILGMMVPMTLNRLKVDPAVATGPFVTTIIDVIALLIYFVTCTLILTL
jgi:magnesium transporter